MNLSLLTASNLVQSFDGIKASKYSGISHVYSGDIVNNEERIIKALNEIKNPIY